MTEAEKKRYEQYKLTYAALMLCYPFTLDDLFGEEWRDISGYNGDYSESNYGRTKSFIGKTPRILKPILHSSGYLQILLHKNGKQYHHYVHILVGEAFIPNPNGLPEIDHHYGNKLDNYFENLEWVTHKENKRRAVQIGLIKSGEENCQAALTNELVEWCREVHVPYDPEFGIAALARKFGVNQNTIIKILRGKTYKNAGGKITPAYTKKRRNVGKKSGGDDNE